MSNSTIDSQLIRWGLKTIDRICKKCMYRKEDRDDLMAEGIFRCATNMGVYLHQYFYRRAKKLPQR